MSSFSSVSTYILRKLWTLIAIVLVLFALLISLLRYSLPYLNDHKNHVESYISSQYSVNLSIQELSASWNRSGPVLVLRGVKIDKGEQSPVALNVSELFLEIDFWPSLQSLSLQSRQVVLNKLSADIEMNQLQTGDAKFPIIEALEKVFLGHLSSFSLIESVITLNSEKNSKSLKITNLSWLNRGNRHQGTGLFALDGFADNNATFILDLYGDASSYSGSLYAQATDIDLSAWVNEFGNLEGKLRSSKGNAEAWARISNGAVQRIDGEIKPSTLDWQNDSFELSTQVSGKFAAIKNKDTWKFALSQFQINSDNEPFIAEFDGQYHPTDGFLMQTRNTLDVGPLLPFSGLFSVALSDQLALQSVSIPSASFNIAVNQSGFWLRSKIADMSWGAYGNALGLQGLQADIAWSNSNGKITLLGRDAVLLSERFLERNLALSKLNIPLFINVADGLKIKSTDAELSAEDLHLSSNVEYSANNQFLSLIVDLSPLTLSQVPQWLPNHLMGKDAKAFLTRAFTGKGQLTGGSVLWHGSLSGFPFDSPEKQGVFQSLVKIKDADFLFSNGWLPLRQLDIDLLFENTGLFMTSQDSLLGNVALSDLRADIPNLTQNALLTIAAKGAAASSDLTDLMLQSSLSDSLGRLLDSSVKIDGELTTDLSLSIPLNDGSKTRAIGEVYLTGNQISIPILNLNFGNTNGIVKFDNEQITIEQLQTVLLEQPISANIAGTKSQSSYDLDINLSGNWDSNLLAQNVGDDFASYLNGETPWDLAVAINLGKEDFIYESLLTTDLIGVTSTLPAPFNKQAQSTQTLVLSAQGSNIASSISANLADSVKFDGALAHKEKQFNRAHLSIGPTEFESRGVGFSISGDFTELALEEWFKVVNALSQKKSGSGNSIIGIPQRVFIDTDRLTVFGETLSDVGISAKRLSDQWSLDIDADQVRANVVVHDNWYSKGVQVNAQYVKLEKPEQVIVSNNESQQAIEYKPRLNIDPKTLPSLDITCKSCILYGVDLGRLEIEAEPNDDGLKLNQILVSNKHGNINSSGQWYKRNKDHFTFIAGDMFSNDIGSFLQLLGFDSGVQDSEANLTFALTWKDSPLDMRFENLDGEVDWRLTDGYLAEVSDKGSRIFSLLSLSSLVRKLSLDFRDVFAKGFFYDNMSGSLQITEGKADTRDTNIDGAAGEIEIYGYTDLSNKELNYNVSFAPNVTGNLPVLVYFFTVSPPSALAALALDQVLTSTKVISNVNYSVTGTIQEPVLIETGRESAEVELPARKDIQAPVEAPDFIPPTIDDLLDIETIDDQSD